MRTIRERLIESVANTLGGQVVYCDDEDLIHAIETAAKTNPAIWSWWQTRAKSAPAVEQDLKAVRQLPTEARSRTSG